MSEALPLFPELQHTRAGITPRDYQIADHDNSFRLWDSGVVGVLTRSFTGSGKTLQACLKADTWLQRSDEHYVLILSYEEQLVNQFAEEVVDYLGITPGIEMAGQRVEAGNLPRIIVASRASLLYHKPPTEDQIAELRQHGINDPGAAPREKIATMLRYLKNDVSVEEVRDELARINAEPEAFEGKWSRVHKFDWRKKWLLVLDEAHKWAHHLKSCGPVIDWFDRNPDSRRMGCTATPKRSDGVSLGDKLFPGIAIDYPLYKPDAPCGVRDGWAVPYIQRYIKVEGVDFKSLKKVAGDFDEGELGAVLGREETLATLVEPLLDMVEDRRTLIFSPTVEMAKDVARYINARSRAVCPDCGKVKWYPTLLLGDGAKCPDCDRMIEASDVNRGPEQAREIDGMTPDRGVIYKAHQRGEFQFLSVCGLCKEGYNDRIISCVAIFRPVSKKASALAEQMKGRGCRVLPGVVDGGLTKEERLAAIANSEKKDCIARGTPILTDQGEVPIENVTTEMKVWDGIEFVAHSGIISRGSQRVIVYAGLAATPDHEVVIHDETNPTSKTETWATFGDCAAKQTPIRVTGFGGTPIRETDCSFRRDYTRDRWGRVPPESARGVRLRRPVAEGLLSPDSGERRLPEVRTTGAVSEMAVAEMCGSAAAVSESERQSLSEVRREGDQVLLPVAIGHGDLGSGQSWTAQGLVAGQEGEQRELRSRKPSIRESGCAGQQPTRPESHTRGSCVSAGASRDQILCGSSLQADPARTHLEANHRPAQQDGRDRHWPDWPEEWEVEVFDILNAGPRHRFTAAGLLVSNCLIVDLVGVTGLGDCASTVQIYAEGIPDEIVHRAEEIMAEVGVDSEIGVEEAITKAKREDAAAKQRAREEREKAERLARERAEKRAKAQAEVEYSTHEVGTQTNTNPDEASEKMYRWMAMLGMKFTNIILKKKQAWRIVDQLLAGKTPEQVAYENGIDQDNWEVAGPSAKQQYAMRGLNVSWVKSGLDASYVLNAKRNIEEFQKRAKEDMKRARRHDHLDTVGRRIFYTNRSVRIPANVYQSLLAYGRECRQKLGGRGEF